MPSRGAFILLDRADLVLTRRRKSSDDQPFAHVCKIQRTDRSEGDRMPMSTVDYAHHVAFPTLTEEELRSLASLAKTCSFKDGEEIFQAGQRDEALRCGIRRNRDRG